MAASFRTGTIVKTAITITLPLTFLWSTNSFGWGALGHKTIAAVAQKHLDPSVANKLNDILAGEDFVNSAIWADEVRAEADWHHTAPYHFANVPANTTYLSSIAQQASCPQNGDVVQALLRAEASLRDQNLSAQQKAYALKFVIHFVGDLHQPLHSGRPEDRGGNSIALNWYGKKTNLHAIWDTYLMSTAHQSDFAGMSYDQQTAWYADYLERGAQQANIPQQSVDVLGWINEAVQFQGSAYSNYSGDQATYMKNNLPIIEQQLVLAGYRLATYLNYIFTSNQTSPDNQGLINQLRSLIPNLDSIINLNPLGALEVDSHQPKPTPPSAPSGCPGVSDYFPQVVSE